MPLRRKLSLAASHSSSLISTATTRVNIPASATVWFPHPQYNSSSDAPAPPLSAAIARAQLRSHVSVCSAIHAFGLLNAPSACLYANASPSSRRNVSTTYVSPGRDGDGDASPAAPGTGTTRADSATPLLRPSTFTRSRADSSSERR